MRKFATDSDSGRPAMGSHLLVVLGVNRPSVDETKMTLSSNDSSRRHERPLPARTERRVQQFSSSSFAFLPSRKVSKHFSRNTTSLPKRILSLRGFRSYEHFRDPSSIYQAPVSASDISLYDLFRATLSRPGYFSSGSSPAAKTAGKACKPKASIGSLFQKTKHTAARRIATFQPTRH